VKLSAATGFNIAYMELYCIVMSTIVCVCLSFFSFCMHSCLCSALCLCGE